MLRSTPAQDVPAETASVARAAFQNGNAYLTLRDELGVIFRDEDFGDLYPHRGQPALPPWRLALVTLVQFRENLSDRQAADAVRARIDLKYLLGLPLDDSGFHYSVLTEFRTRLLESGKEETLLERLLHRCQDLGLIKVRGRTRTDATRVFAAVRVLNRLELVAETLRAALNDLAGIAPGWLQRVAPAAWFERYGRRIEDSRLPESSSAREAYACTVGEDGFKLLDLLHAPGTPEGLAEPPSVRILARVWQRHFVREPNLDDEGPGEARVCLRPERDLPPAAEGVESPFDSDARYRSRFGMEWTGYMVHLSETCEEDTPHLVTHVDTTDASVHEVKRVQAIHDALAAKGMLPGEHLTDAAYIDAKLLVKMQAEHGVTMIGPPRKDPSWQARTAGAFTTEQFEIDWEEQQVRCPQGHTSRSWKTYEDEARGRYVKVRFAPSVCQACPSRKRCTRSGRQGRSLSLHPREAHEAMVGMRELIDSDAGSEQYALRAGVEGTISQGVRAFGLRKARYRGLAKVHLQQVATAAAMNIDRVVAFLQGRPLAPTRQSRFAALQA